MGRRREAPPPDGATKGEVNDSVASADADVGRHGMENDV